MGGGAARGRIALLVEDGQDLLPVVPVAAVAARFLGGVQGGIGPLDDRFLVLVAHDLGGADADGDLEFSAGNFEVGVGNRLAQARQGPLDLADRGAVEDHGKFLAAVAGDGIALAQDPPQDAAGAAEDLVARLVAVGVVEPLELVQVDHGQREDLSRAVEIGQALGDVGLEGPAIADQGQGVGAGLGRMRLDQPDLLAEPVFGLVQPPLHGLVGIDQLGDDVEDLGRFAQLVALQFDVDFLDAGIVFAQFDRHAGGQFLQAAQQFLGAANFLLVDGGFLVGTVPMVAPAPQPPSGSQAGQRGRQGKEDIDRQDRQHRDRSLETLWQSNHPR